MKKLILLLLISLNGLAQENNSYGQNLEYGDKPTPISFNNEIEMVSHLKKFKSQTYKYYIKLDSVAKDKVYQSHIRNSEKNITYIILELYLARS